MTLVVQYEGFNFDYVSPYILDRLIADKSLQGFYRPSEKRWVNIYRDPVRGIGGDYSGPNRRQDNKAPRKCIASIKDKTI